jgi:hypothetical protein
MKQLGTWLMIFGLGSIALNFLGLEFTLLMWIDNWGPTVGWGIRAGLAAVGAVLFFLGMRQTQSPAQNKPA